MSTQTTYEIKHADVILGTSLNRYVETWVKSALADLEEYLNSASIISNWNIAQVSYHKSSGFILVEFDRLTTIHEDTLKDLKGLGFEFNWFQDFIDLDNCAYHLSFKYKKKSD